MENLIYFIIWAAFIFLMMRFGCGSHVMGHGHTTHGRGDVAKQDGGALRWTPPESDIDPVCGKTVHTDRAKSSVHDGKVYYSCSRECRERFEAAPELYLQPLVDDGATTEEHTNV